jgi:hypothetical protein
MEEHLTPATLVAKLIDSENNRNRPEADEILAADFAEITRARGVEQTRQNLLDEIQHPLNPLDSPLADCRHLE